MQVAVVAVAADTNPIDLDPDLDNHLRCHGVVLAASLSDVKLLLVDET
jgi:hypothetical protein